ncbi:cytochrome b/b6 domain-containing protein [Roseibacterium sp. SDUM158017]|uniref:cytochrome b n=1 Tax=Roseicyclus salinarum TaxID=3036773 RepID=UPI0024151BD6|nr:cytochrome b/b6 domain-containing protein [Roseibacterium sp. SDUM158017]MDG4648939.1 cytochrome b/b6 domain-containing protein [Roseibacterium sp. SDUM158017]
MQRYHPLLVALHWLMALMILVALAAGGLVLANMPPDSPDKVSGLGGHMIFGMAIGVLLILRLVTRTRSVHPPHAETGHALLDRIGRWTHWGFYALIAGMVLTGLATALGAGLFPIVYGGAAETLPPELAAMPTRVVHGLIATLLLALIALHFLAALYHQIVLKDGLLRRMWFGKRSA